MRTRFFAVDRIEGGRAVLVDDDGAARDVALADLPPGLREGVVLRVPVARTRPEWAGATVDEEEARRRLAEAERALDRLRRRDPGGRRHGGD